MIGKTLSHYRITAKLGEGGMGVVYRAHDKHLDREVAIKVLPEDFATNPDRLARFEREAKAVAQLSHPNIMAIFDFGREDGVTYAVAELLAGETLRERLANTQINWRKATEIGADIADGLAAAHQAGIIHRDLKPSNVFLTSDGRVKVLDFGLARSVDIPGGGIADAPTVTRQTAAGSVLGTVGYMSPEQVRGEPTDHRSDIFALGCVIYEMVSGYRAFCKDTAVETMSAILREEPAGLSSAETSLPQGLENTIRRCFEKGSGARFQSASDLAYNLRSILSSSVPSSSGERNVEKRVARDPLERSRRRYRIALLSMVALISVAGVRWSVENRRPVRSIRTMAVLASPDTALGPESDYLGELLAARLTATLSYIPQLEVQSQQAVKRHSSQKSDVVELGRVLGVDAVLTTELRETLGQLIVAVEVTDVKSGMYVWGEVFRRPLDESGEVHEAIALDVAENLQLRLDAAERQSLSLFQKYQQATYFWSQRTAGSLNRAVDLFRQIITEDPEFAEAHAGMASSLILLSYYGGLSPAEAYERARVASEMALSLNETLAEAHAALGLVKRDYDRDWPGATLEFERAIQLDPQSGSSLQWYAELLASIGRFEEAETSILAAKEADPLSSLAAHAVHGWILLCAGRYQEAETQLRATLQMDPDFHLPHWFLGELLIARGDYQAAIEPLMKAVELTGRSSRPVANLAFAHAKNGNREEARRLLSELQDLSESGGNVTRYEYALVFVGLGDHDRAIRELEGALVERTWQVANMGIDPLLEPLRDDVRYRQLLLRAGLPSG